MINSPGGDPKFVRNIDGAGMAAYGLTKAAALVAAAKYAAALKAETLRRLADTEARLQSVAGAAAVEAEMLESPTLGRWPVESQGFPREDVGAQRVELAGLAFAVDICLGEPRILML